jgi:hypothetical protein
MTSTMMNPPVFRCGWLENVDGMKIAMKNSSSRNHLPSSKLEMTASCAKSPRIFFLFFSKSDRNPEIPGWFMDVFMVALVTNRAFGCATKSCDNLVESPQINPPSGKLT